MLRLRPNIPLLWISSTTLQLGVQRPVARLEATDAEADAVAHMRAGLHPAHLAAMVGAGRAEEVHATVMPALSSAPPNMRARVTGTLPLAKAIMEALRSSGLGAGRSVADTLVSVAAWKLPEAERQRALSRDLRHLPVIVGDATITVGPLWVPDATPCSRCALDEPEMVPLGDEQDSVLELTEFERAAAIGAVGAVLGPVAAGAAPSARRIDIERITCAVTARHQQPDPACGCLTLADPAETSTGCDVSPPMKRSA